MFERFVEPAKKVVFFSRYEASQAGKPSIEPVDLFLATIREKLSLRAESLTARAYSGLEVNAAKKTLGIKKAPEEIKGDIPLSPEARSILEKAFAEAGGDQDDTEVRCEHIIFALLQDGQSPYAALLHGVGLTARSVQEEITR